MPPSDQPTGGTLRSSSETPSLPPLPGMTRMPNGDILSIEGIEFGSDDDDDDEDYETASDDAGDRADDVEYGYGDGLTLDEMMDEAEAMEELEAAFGLNEADDDDDDEMVHSIDEDEEDEEDEEGGRASAGFQGSMHDLVQGASSDGLLELLGARRRELTHLPSPDRPPALVQSCLLAVRSQASRTARHLRRCLPSFALLSLDQVAAVGRGRSRSCATR